MKYGFRNPWLILWASHPTGVRGLKSVIYGERRSGTAGRTPLGCVD